jgi:antitoxin component of RelBE/YafQ-DinJ toxin-antitoxin module
MTKVIINNKTKKGKLILDLIREMNCGEIIEEEPNEETIKAIQEARNGELKKAENSKDLSDKLGL